MAAGPLYRRLASPPVNLSAPSVINCSLSVSIIIIIVRMMVFKGVSKIWGVYLSHLSYKRPTTAVIGGEGRGMGSNCPLPSRMLPQLGLGRSFIHDRKRFWGVSCAILILMRFHASFSAVNSCLETGDSCIPLLARRSDIPL